MDPHRFDRLSKAIANRLTRRQMLGGLSAGGLAVAALGEAPSLAANGDATCVYDFDGVIGMGPSSTLGATSVVAGELAITIGPDGAIDSGKLVRAGGDSWAVVGQAVGRAINLRFSVPKTGAFIAVGTGRKDIASCTTAMGGPASGPLRGDVGSWTATLKSGGASATPTATPGMAPTMIATAGTTTPQPTGTPEAAPTGAATETAACDIDCGGDTLGRDPNSCACLCAAGLVNCTFEVGSIPAKGGVIFNAKPLTKPRGFCIDLTTDSSNCGACAQACEFNSNMTSSTCVAGVCNYVCKPGFDTCPGDEPCLSSLSYNNNHCGDCNTQCTSPYGCVETHCACVDSRCGTGNAVNADCTCICNNGLTACGYTCTDLNTDVNNCGGCGQSCGPVASECSAGQCHALVQANQ